GYSIAMDSAGNSYVTGNFRGTARFGATTLTSSGYEDIYVCKLDPNGNFIWAKKAGGSSNDYGKSIDVDSAGNCYVTGYFYGTASFGATTLTSSGEKEILACKLDPNGNFLWAKKAGGMSYDQGFGIAVDSAGNSYVTGCFEGSANFGEITLISSGYLDIFVCTLDTNGNFVWAVQAGGVFSCGYGIAVDSAGNSYVTGKFRYTASFGAHIITNSGEYDIFACKLDADGVFRWAVQAGGSRNDYGCGIAVDSAGNSNVAGYFLGTASFGAHILTSSGSYDIFFCKLGSGTPVDDPTVPELAGDPILYPAWPNPCLRGQSASIKAVVAERETGTLSVYNLRGELISRRELASGEHVISLDSRELPSGLYFYRLATPSGVAVKKMAIIR
ncbi:MAG: SBBP repeat-containing protein, partial [Candidatus Syntrophosphaera sp.]